jgi:hypothetical protein
MSTKSTANGYTGFARRALAPAVQFNEIMALQIERVARFQYETAGEIMQFGLDQLNATAKAKDLPTAMARQREIITKFVEKAQARQAALADLASESQAEFAGWFDGASASMTGKA